MSDYHLTVTEPFGAYARGDRIEDADEVDRVLASEHERLVLKTHAPAQPLPASYVSLVEPVGEGAEPSVLVRASAADKASEPIVSDAEHPVEPAPHAVEEPEAR